MRWMKPGQIAVELEKEPLVTHTSAAAILGISAPNLRRDYGGRLTPVPVQAGAVMKLLYFRSEVEALARDRAAAHPVAV